MSTGKYDYEKFNATWLGQACFLSFCGLYRRHFVDGIVFVACSPVSCSASTPGATEPNTKAVHPNIAPSKAHESHTKILIVRLPQKSMW